MPDLTEVHTPDQHSQEWRCEEGVDCLRDSQLRHELHLAFSALGGVAFALLHHQALTDERLDRAAKRIYELYAQLDRVSGAARVGLHGHDGPALPGVACL
jgi:hypothetical protein